MEFKTSKSELLKAVNLVASVTSSKASSLPILGNILLETVKGDCLSLVGTDLEVGISTKIPIHMKQEGSISVPAKKMLDIVRELPEGDVEIIVAKNNAVNIKAGKSFFKIMGLNKEDYPKLPEWKEENAFEIEQALLKESFALTIFAISSDESRYVLNGILIAIKDKKIKFVATDGRRLALFEKDLIMKSGQNYEFIIPAKAIHEIAKMLSWEGTVKIIPSQNQILFHFGDTYLISRLIEGHFPNYEQVIPKEEKTKAKVNREELLQAVKRTAILTSADSPAVKVDYIKGKILVSSKAPNLGEAKEEIAAEIEGKEISIGYNPNYLVDVLKNLEIENVTMSLTEADKPGLICGKEGYKYVVMPMQIN